MTTMRSHCSDCQAVKLAELARGVVNTIEAYGMTDPQVTSILEFLIQWVEAPGLVDNSTLGSGWVATSTLDPVSSHRHLEFYHATHRARNIVFAILYGRPAMSAPDKPMVVDCCNDI